MQLNIYDMDGTIVDSTAAIKQCQLDGLSRATGNDMLQLEQILKEKGLKKALSHFDIDQDTFYKTHYKTFEPFKAARDGQMNVFDDAQIHFTNQQISKYANPFNCLVSNSQIDATRNKLEAANIAHIFKLVFAEYEKEKAKPTAYMAKELLDSLKNYTYAGKQHDITDFIVTINNVGDNPIDIEFGNVVYETLASGMKHKPSFNNYFIDRNGTYESMKDAKIIKSLTEIQ